MAQFKVEKNADGGTYWKLKEDNTMTNTQQSNIMKHLRTAGSITVREAMIEYHISSLTKRIHELRGMGIDIESVRKQHPVTGQRYTRYVLIEDKDQ